MHHLNNLIYIIDLQITKYNTTDAPFQTHTVHNLYGIVDFF
jgi:hypothetical protein